MRILIAEDDFASRKLLLKFMSEYGECDSGWYGSNRRLPDVTGREGAI